MNGKSQTLNGAVTFDKLSLSMFRNFRMPSLLMASLLLVVGFLVLTPLGLMILNSFQTARPGQPILWGVDGWIKAFTTPGIVKAMTNTFTLAITRQAIALVLGCFFAWLIARTDIPMKGFLEFFFWLSFFLPALPEAMGWILLLDPKYGLLNQGLMGLGIVSQPVFNIYSFWGIVWAHLGGSVSVKVMLLTPAFRNLDAALEESSRISGASGWRTFFNIIVPVMMPAILVTTILGIIRSLEAFEIELLLGTPIGLQVYSTKIHELVTWEPPQFAPAMALSTIFLGLLLLMVALQRRYIGKRIYTTLTGRGFSIRPTHLGRWRMPAFALVLAFALFVTLVPTALLSTGTFMKLFGFFNIAEPWTLENWRATLNDPVLLRSLWNTLAIGLGSGVIGVLFYSLIAYVVVRTRHRGRWLLDFLSWLPWSIPGILLGMALLWTFLQTKIFLPIYGTIYLLMVAMVIKSMPFGTQMIKSVLLQLGNDLEEASKVCGGTWLDTFRRVILPLTMPALITVGLVGFISAARDLSTVVLLGSGKSRTLSLLMLDFAAGAEFEKATVVAVLIVALVVVAALFARALGGQIGVRE
ncbi:MAG: iron ABC transporter permease [Deltaproteobacteria bacterium]|nr:iron ABC transporter permease [Deltaproteobacteria bacterium]MBI2181359.1 iron ABC transporter permease [Deltaproteobacteria bacterium]MBI2228365.1 iron ABC transporter permease [Deltaproteobacteria bacterium]MBI2531993.1 iron ABC transporter permease [Deltaproteobacteria bacterium]